MIRLEKVCKYINENKILSDINLTIADKEVLVVLGPSGGGKTTLLRCINGLETPSEGNIYLHDKKITKAKISKLTLKTGMVFQQFNLFPHFSVIKNLTYAPVKVLKQCPKKANNKAEKLLKQFGLFEKVNEMPSSLSGGQKQRVSIARALMMNPEVLLFDEPTSALDVESTKKLLNVVLDLKEQMTVVVVTHLLSFAQAIADRIIFMDQGYILSDQNNADFFNKTKSERAKLFIRDSKFEV